MKQISIRCPHCRKKFYIHQSKIDMHQIKNCLCPNCSLSCLVPSWDHIQAKAKKRQERDQLARGDSNV